MQFIKFVFPLLFTFSVYAQQPKTPKFLTKQALEHLRYISKDGKFTYFQTNSGALNMTTNYDNTVLHDAPKGSHYLMQDTPTGKNLVIQLIEKYHSLLSVTRDYKLFYSSLGEKKLTYLAEGRSPTMSLNDTWFGYYTHLDKTVHFQSLLNKDKKIELVLANEVNEYFIPQIDMITPELIIYTDINKKGHIAILSYNSVDKKFKPVYKSKFPGSKIEFCLRKKDLIVGEFSIYDSDKGSSIVSIPIYGNKNYRKKTTIYRTESSDIGNILCDEDEIYFIKTVKFNPKLNSRVTEVARINLKNNELKIISDLESVTQIVKMGGRILVPHRQSFYIIKGDHDTTTQDALESK
jgi:hypothetical protein